MKTITQEKLKVILEKHKLWLYSMGKEGERAYLKGADLQYANLQRAGLQYANLQYADLQGADLQYTDLRDTYLQGANLQGADLQHADLQGANLQGADLRDTNLDYSCFPLWCGGTNMKLSDNLVQQVLAHLCSCEVSEKTREELNKVLDFAKCSHRAIDCNILGKK